MGVYRHLLGDSDSIVHFRDLYKVPSNVEVRPDTPDDGLTYRDGWMPFWLVSVVEGGVRFPLHPLVRDCLWEWRLCPCQLLPNVYKIIMGVVRLNQILGIGLGVPDIEDTYDLCKSAEGDTYYLRLRVRRTGFVTALEDSNRYAGEDKVLVRGGWEFGEVEPATTVRVPRKIGIPPSKGRSSFGLQFFSLLFWLLTWFCLCRFSRKEGAREEESLESEQRLARAGEELPRPQLPCCLVPFGVRAPLSVLQHLQKGVGDRLRL